MWNVAERCVEVVLSCCYISCLYLCVVFLCCISVYLCICVFVSHLFYLVVLSWFVLLLFVFAVLWVAVVGCRCLAGSHDDLVGAKAKEEDLAPKVRKRKKTHVLIFNTDQCTNLLRFLSVLSCSLSKTLIWTAADEKPSKRKRNERNVKGTCKAKRKPP